MTDPVIAQKKLGRAQRVTLASLHKRMTPRMQLTIQIVLAGRRWRALLDDHLKTMNQSAARMETLSAIKQSPPRSNQIEIARRIGVEGATLTRMLDTLEKDGLVERLAVPNDRRAKQIRLTGQGEKILAEIMARADELRNELLVGLDPEEIDHANAFLGSLLECFDIHFDQT